MLQVLNNKHGINVHTNLTVSSLMFEDSKFPPPTIPSKHVSLWDPTTGIFYIFILL